MMLRALLVLAVLAAVLPASAPAAVVLNEVNCKEDWIELANTSSSPADVSGWMLTDDERRRPRADHRYVFRAGRSVPGDGYVTVRKGKAGGLGLPFGLACGEDTIRLVRSAGARKAVDEVEVPELTKGSDAFGRYPTAGGAWRQTVPTKRAPNEPSTAGGAPEPDLTWLFEPTAVHEIFLTVPQASLDALAADPRTYVPASFALKAAGVRYRPYEVGVRLKGDSSFRPLTAKAAFKIKFNHVVKGQRFHGLRHLTLNNMIQDRSMVREAVAYEAFRAAGLPASRSGYAFVRVNGAAYGLYANVETVDAEMLRKWPAWFPSTRHLYEGETHDDVVPPMAAQLKVDEGDPSDRGDLEALVGALANTAAPYSQRLAPVADLAQLTRFWAVEKYLGHEDGYSGNPNNYYLHSDEAGRFRMLPSGLDKTLSDRVPYGPTRSTRPQASSSAGDEGGRLFTSCVVEPACKQLYLAAVADVRRRMPGLRLESRVDAIAAALRPWQALDPRLEHPPALTEETVARARAFLASRSSDHAWNGRGDAVVGDPGLPPVP